MLNRAYVCLLALSSFLWMSCGPKLKWQASHAQKSPPSRTYDSRTWNEDGESGGAEAMREIDRLVLETAGDAGGDAVCFDGGPAGPVLEGYGRGWPVADHPTYRVSPEEKVTLESKFVGAIIRYQGTLSSAEYGIVDVDHHYASGSTTTTYDSYTREYEGYLYVGAVEVYRCETPTAVEQVRAECATHSFDSSKSDRPY